MCDLKQPMVETKGGHLCLNASHFIFISNTKLNDQFAGALNERRKAFSARFYEQPCLPSGKSCVQHIEQGSPPVEDIYKAEIWKYIYEMVDEFIGDIEPPVMDEPDGDSDCLIVYGPNLPTSQDLEDQLLKKGGDPDTWDPENMEDILMDGTLTHTEHCPEVGPIRLGNGCDIIVMQCVLHNFVLFLLIFLAIKASTP